MGRRRRGARTSRRGRGGRGCKQSRGSRNTSQQQMAPDTAPEINLNPIDLENYQTTQVLGCESGDVSGNIPSISSTPDTTRSDVCFVSNSHPSSMVVDAVQDYPIYRPAPENQQQPGYYQEAAPQLPYYGANTIHPANQQIYNQQLSPTDWGSVYANESQQTGPYFGELSNDDDSQDSTDSVDPAYVSNLRMGQGPQYHQFHRPTFQNQQLAGNAQQVPYGGLNYFQTSRHQITYNVFGTRQLVNVNQSRQTDIRMEHAPYLYNPPLSIYNAIPSTMPSGSQQWSNNQRLPFNPCQTAISWYPGSYFQRTTIIGPRFQETRIQAPRFQETRIQGPRLQETRIQGPRQETRLRDVRLPNTRVREARLQEARLQEARLQEARLQEARLQEARLREAHLQEAHLQEAHLQDTRPQDTCSQDTRSQDTRPQDTSPQNTSPQNTSPQDTSPQDTLPQDFLPQDTRPRDTRPQDTRPQDNRPQDTRPQETRPRDTRPRDTRPRDTRPEDTRSRDTRPQETRPRDTRPPDTRPPDTRPPDTRPPDTRPPDTRPPDTRPPDTRPQDTRPRCTRFQNTRQNTRLQGNGRLVGPNRLWAYARRLGYNIPGYRIVFDEANQHFTSLPKK